MNKIKWITGIAFFVLFCSVAGKLGEIALQADYDTYEGLNAFLQAGSLEKASPSEASTLVGGRTLLLLLSGIQSVASRFLHRPLNLSELHLMMVALSLCSILGWVAVGARLLGHSWGWLLGILLLLDRVWLSQSFFLQADILGSFFWALMVLALSHLLEELDRETSRARLFLFSIYLGVLGGAVATTKPHYVWLGPLLVVGMWATFIWHLAPGNVQRKQFWDRVVVSLIFGIVYTALIGLTFRFYGGPGLGFLAHIRELRDIYAWGMRNWARSSYWVYTRYLWGSYGPLFWGIVGISAAVAVRNRRVLIEHWERVSAWRRNSLVSLGLVATAYLYVTQTFSYREERYLFAFLPFILIVCTALMASLLEIRLSGAKAVWIGTLAIILIFPLRNVRTELSTLGDRVSPSERAQRAAFWNYLQTDSPLGQKCGTIRACAFFHSGVEFHKPNYLYRLGRGAEVSHCQFASLNVAAQLAGQASPGDCLVVPSSYHVESAKDSFVVVKKVLLSRGSASDAQELQQQVRLGAPGEKLGCETEGQGTSCYAYKSFFGIPTATHKLAVR